MKKTLITLFLTETINTYKIDTSTKYMLSNDIHKMLGE